MNKAVYFLKRVWNFVDQLNTQLKTIIIVVLVVLLTGFYFNETTKNILSDYIETREKEDQKLDKYTIEIAPKIHQCIQLIAEEDEDCFNVLLLNYHNSRKSLQGIRYLYLNCIAEAPKGIENEQVKQYWSDLEYIYFQDELYKIHRSGFLRIQNIENVRQTLPKLYKKLVISEAKAAAFYPIEGVESPIGMIVVLYKEPMTYQLGSYQKELLPHIQKLSTLLDYPNLSYKK